MPEELPNSELDNASPAQEDGAQYLGGQEPFCPSACVRWTQLAAIGLFLIASAAILLWSASQWVPRFYLQSLAVPQQQSAKSGREFEQQVFSLHDYLANPNAERGRWQAVFTDEQINGWLAVELPKKFPKLLPAGVSDPRVKIEADKVTIACKCDHRELSAIISLEFDAYLTQQPNVIAVRLQDGRIGAVPGMRKLAVDQIRYSAWRSHIPISWAQKDGAPVLLIPVPPSVYEQFGDLQIEHMQFSDGAMAMAGEITRLTKVAKHVVPTRRLD